MQKNEMVLPENLKHLPAAQKADELIELMKSHSVIVVEGETGSGKSVVLPTVIAKHYGSQYSRVIVTQNRRILCESIAGFVSQSMRCEVGVPIGYHFKGERKGNSNTLLSFETTGTVLSQLTSNPWLAGIRCIVIDEVHEGTVDQHILLSHLKRILDSNSNFRIVLMSATLSSKDKKRFKNFFNCPVGYLTVEGRSYPVERKFTGDQINCNLPYKRIRNQVLNYTTETIVKAYDDIEEGTILAFLPGKAEIADVTRRLSQYALTSYSLYADTDEDEKKEAIASITNDKKIVLCTEIARSGLTVEGVKAVISSGYARVGQVETMSQVSGIKTDLTDWASLKQEGGRTGRTCPGVHYIIGDENTQRAEQPQVALKKTDITGKILNLLATVNDISSFEWFVSPDEMQKINVIRNLSQLGAVESKQNEGTGWRNSFTTKITSLGVLLSRIPVNPQIGKLLLVAKYLGVEKEGAILASVLLNKVRLPYEWAEITKSVSEDNSYYVDERKYENDLEAIIMEFENGYFDNVQNGCVLNTVNELLQSLSSVSNEEMNSLGFDHISIECEDNIEALKIAVVNSFGHHAGMYVIDDTILTEKYYEELKGDNFYTASSENSLRFNTMKNSRFNNHKKDGLILIPLNLFYFENDINCSIALDITFDELKKLAPNQASKLQVLHNEIGSYQAPMQGKYDKQFVTEEERIWTRLFAMG